MPTYDLGSSTFQLTIHSSFNFFKFWQLLDKYAYASISQLRVFSVTNVPIGPQIFLAVPQGFFIN